MKIDVQVKPNCKKEGVEQLPDGIYRVSVNSPPTEGRANEAVIDLLAEHFRVRKTAVHILSGVKSKRKRIEIDEY